MVEKSFIKMMVIILGIELFFCGVKSSVIWQQIHLMYSRHELFVDKEATWCNMFVEVGSVFYLPK